MWKKIITPVFAIALALSINGCSSNSSEDDQESGQAATELEGVESGEGTDLGAAEEGATQPEGEALADLGEEQPSSNEEMPSDEVIESEPVDDTKTADIEAEANSVAAAPPVAEPAPEPTPEPAPEAMPSTSGEDLFGGGATTAQADEAPRPVASLKKVKEAPFKEGKILANTVYIARDGDTMESVSQKTGASTKDLKKVNSFLSRGVKVGDKIYYQSTKRPEDAERMLTYYEDNGFSEQTYTAKSGENIRDIAKNLLGHKDSWKELWVTNTVESKGALDEGTTLRYWSDSVPPPIAAAEPPPPPIEEPATQDLPPPPQPSEPAATAAIAPPTEPPPPPPPVVEPPKPPKIAKKSDGFLIPGLGQDETFAVGGLALLGVLLGIGMMLRKSKAKKLSSQTQTQI